MFTAVNNENDGIYYQSPASASNTITQSSDDTIYKLQITDENVRSSAKCSHNERKILESLNQVLSKQSQILEEIESMKKVQDNIAQKVACFSVQLDDLALQIKQPEIEVQSLSQTSSKAESKPIYLKPIQNEEGLNDMERKLANNNTKETLFQSYSIVCNKGKAVDCAYTYAEIMFNRKFLCQCS